MAIAIVVLLPLGLALVERRRITTPLVFQCRRCGAHFEQAPHVAYPRACAKCGAPDWAT
ncbi:MAG TPA: hypothetical protein VM513_31230 [Kofleriaceae bacterium]|nr:hypothetical protein [Kofleriaceae bacterium]